MSFKEHLEDLKADYPKIKILYASDIATIINKSEIATRRMLDKRSIPNLKVYAGSLGISIVNMAHHLTALDEEENEKTETPEQNTKIRQKPQKIDRTKATRAAPRFKDLMKMAQREIAFWQDFYTAIEKLALSENKDVKKPEPKGL